MVTRRVRFRAVIVTVAVGSFLAAAVAPAAAAPPSNDDFDHAAAFGALPFTQTLNTAEATTASDDPAPSCAGTTDATVWFSFSPTQNQRVSADTLGSNYDTTLSAFTGSRGALAPVACNDDAEFDVWSRVQFNVQAGTTYFFMVASQDLTGGTLTFTADLGPANDDFDDATVVGALPYTDAVDTKRASTADDDPTSPCIVSAEATVWYSFTPSEAVRVVADTFGSNYDTNLSVYRGSRGSLNRVACNEDAGNDVQSKVQFDATAGTTYHFMVAGFDAGGQLAFSVKIGRTNTRLSLSVSKTWVFANESVTVTAHLDAFETAQNQEVSIYGTPRGGTKKLVSAGMIDLAGNLRAGTTLKANTTFVAEWSGDDRFLPATSNKKLVSLGVDPGDWFGTTFQAYTIEFFLKGGTHLTQLEVGYRIKFANCPGSAQLDTTVKLKTPLRLRDGKLHVTWRIGQISSGEVSGRFVSRVKAKGTLGASFRDPKTGCHGEIHGIKWHATAF